ncbi:hypothetical protein OHW50_00435 [Acinetobacter baumannii]|nr:hypothetical protein [Acinetobacter baumannii]
MVSKFRIVSENNGGDGVHIEKGVTVPLDLEIKASGNAKNGLSVHADSLESITSLDLETTYNKGDGFRIFSTNEDLRTLLQLDENVDLEKVKKVIIEAADQPEEKRKEFLSESFLNKLDKGSAVAERAVKLIATCSPELIVGMLSSLS